MVFRIAVNRYADFYKELVGYVMGALDAADMAAGVAYEERNAFKEEEKFIVDNVSIPFYGVRQLTALYDGSECNDAWEILISVNPALFSKYQEIVPWRVFKYFKNWIPDSMKETTALLGFICEDAYGELFTDYMSTKRNIKKFGKTMVIPYVNIDGVELHEGYLIEILEAVLDGPVNNYEVSDSTADELVKLGYLEIIGGERQARLYRIKDREACEELYNFLFTDDNEMN